MRIAHKISAALLAAAGGMIALGILVQRPVLVDKFTSLQKQKAEANLRRCDEAIHNYIEAIEKQSRDWASWDDTYKFVQDNNETFRRVNLSPNFFDTTDLDLIFIVDLNGKVVHGRALLPNGKVANSLSGLDPSSLATTSHRKPKSGLNLVSGYPAALAMRPILDSSEKKPPKGLLVMGRFLTDVAVAKVARQVGVHFQLVSLDTMRQALPQDSETALERVEHHTSDPVANQEVVGFQEFPSFSGPSALAVRCTTTPDILIEGIATVDSSFITMATGSSFAAVFTAIIIFLTVSSPLRRLAHRLEGAKEGDVLQLADLSRRGDEIGTVGRSFESLMARLEAAQTRLLHATREAGMAEVAKEVLHNAGNVLNSLSISGSQVEKLSAQLNLGGMSKAIQLIQDHEGCLDDFLRNDPKGSRVLPYLTSLCEKLEAEHDALRAESKVLVQMSNHIGQIVQSQALFADKSAPHCQFRLSTVVREAQALMEKSFTAHGVTAEFNLDDSLAAIGDPSKALQVIVNLLTNAKDAVRCREIGDRKLRVTAHRLGCTGFELRIADNGQGIEKENLEVIFQQGFTTKQSGIGFGLHYCANATAQMGWTLHAESEGPGLGATLVIRAQAQTNQEAA